MKFPLVPILKYIIHQNIVKSSPKRSRIGFPYKLKPYPEDTAHMPKVSIHHLFDVYCTHTGTPCPIQYFDLYIATHHLETCPTT